MDLLHFARFTQSSAETIAKKLRTLYSHSLEASQALVQQEALACCDRLGRHAQNTLEAHAPPICASASSTFEVEHVASVAIEACADLLVNCSVSLRNETQPRLRCVGDRNQVHRLLCAMLEDAIARSPAALDLCINSQAHGVAFTLSATPRARGTKSEIAPSMIALGLAHALGGQFSARREPVPALTALLPLHVLAATESRPSDSGLRILAAEDNPGARAIMEAILLSLGHQVEMVPTGVEAVRAAKERVFDLIILDVGLPAMNGLDACAAIRRSEGGNQTTPIIAITALAPEIVLEKAAEAGMDAVLPKPIEIGRLIATIRLLLQPHSIDAAEIEDIQNDENNDKAANQPESHSQSPTRAQRARP